VSAGQIGILAQLGTAIPLVVVFWYLHRLDGELHLRIWAWSWAVSVTRLVAEMALDSTSLPPSSEMVILGAGQIGMSLSAFLLLWGTLVFVDRRMPRWGVATFLLTVVWIAAALTMDLSFLVVSGPIWLYVGAVYIVLGLVILHGYWSGGGRLTGIAFLAWGIHKADYPVMRSVEWFSPIGFILGSGLQVLVATGMILMHLGQVRERLETDEERLQMIAEHVQDIVYRYRLGPEKGFEYVSPAVTRITGYTPEECYADPDIMAKIVAPEDRERLRAIMSASDLNRIDTVERCVTKRGDSVWLEQRAIVVRDEQGRRVAHEGIVRDVTALREKDREQARLVAAVRHAAEAVVVLDPDLSVRYVNSAFTTMMGWREDEVLGKMLNTTLSSSAKLSPAIWADIDAGETYIGEVKPRRKDGGQVTGRVSIAAVRDEEGRTLNYVVVAADITHQKELELQLEQGQKMEALGRMAAGIAHDFNNILTVARGSADRLALCMGSDGEGGEELEDMHECLQRGADLTGRLLSFSRGRILQETLVDVNQLVKNLENLLGRFAGEGILIRYELSESPALVHADGSQLERVLMNLVSNARDAVENDRGNIVISVGEWVGTQVPETYCTGPLGSLIEGGCVMLSVRDDGSGISGDHIPHVFEPFFTRKTRVGGTGLGLATVCGIVKQSGGEVEVESEVGEGTCFRVLLPRAADGALPEDGGGGLAGLPDAGEKEAAESAGRAALAEMPGSVLLVDDEISVRKVAARALRDTGCRVVQASSGEEALRLMEVDAEDVAVVVTDVVMPGMGGLNLAYSVRELREGVGLVFLSGYAGDQVVPEDILDSRSVFLEKPFGVEDLVTAVARVSPQLD